ncbi:IRK-interacting protein-like [Quillaja saponaria]|uniref:IRK-interacting protein-like n=1 Tax=Quillaja saponaria TaxID=32244 RepID=A0AAD7QI55_QUISA|nr:IRK-interacting protein-like [Quillaja saponaria]
MDSVKLSAATPSKNRLARTFAKVLHLRAVTGIATQGGIKKDKIEGKVKDDGNMDKRRGNWSQSFDSSNEELEDEVAVKALLAKLFASISSVKAAYAQVQYAQSPYDSDGIQAADELLVSELKNLSELKQCYLKKQYDPSPQSVMLAAEIKEQQSVLKTYEIMGKKLESQVRLKDSEIIFLREKLEEANRQNRGIVKILNQSGPLFVLDNLHISGLSPTHFVTVLRHTVRSIRSFVRLMVEEMRSASWDIDAAVNAIEQNVVFWNDDRKCFAFESFVCREMFNSFQFPNFSLQDESLPDKKQQLLFFARFNGMKSMKTKELLAQKPRSTFATFCRIKYLRLIHPKLESSLFGDLSQRNVVKAGEFPNTTFFNSFAEMAKRVWLLHCLAFSFEPEASIFHVRKGCQFSEVYMASVNDEVFLSSGSDGTMESDPQVAFTAVPGFRIGKTVIQCQVYLSQFKTKLKKNNPDNQR